MPQIDKVGALERPSRCLVQYRLEPGRLESSSRVGALYHYCTLLIVKKKLIKVSIPSLFILCSKYISDLIGKINNLK